MKIIAKTALLTLLAFTCLQTVAAAPAQVWRMVSPSLPIDRLNAVAHGDGKFVAVGDSGLVMTSSNGVDWLELRVEGGPRWRTVIFADGRFFIGGDSGKISWSDDGGVWASAELPSLPNHTVTAMEFGKGENLGGGLFVAMATITGSLAPAVKTVSLLSTNGINWVMNSVGGDYTREPGYSRIVYANGRFVAAQNLLNSPSSLRAVTSVNGTNWLNASVGGTGALTAGGGIFVVARLHTNSDSGVKLVSGTSLNGSIWPVINISGGYNFVYDACFGGGRFVAVSQLGTADVSADGTNWVTHQVGIDAALRGVTFGDGLYVAVGEGGSIFTSEDAVVWKRQGMGTSQNLLGAGPYDDGFVAVGSGGSILWSPDGVVWTPTNSPTTNALQSVIQRDGKLICVGQGGTILQGVNLGGLIPAESGTQLSLQDIAHGINRFVIVGQSGAVLTSENGRDWLVGNSGVTNNLDGVAFGGGRFVAVGEAGTVLSSTDGYGWFVHPSGTTRSFSDVVYGRGVFVAAAPRQSPGNGPYAISSSDGTTWETSDVFITLVARSIAYGNGYFILPYSSGAIWVSSDGRNWEVVGTSSTAPLQQSAFQQSALAFNNGVFISAGRLGMIFHTDPVIRLEVLSRGPVCIGLEGVKGKSYRIESRDDSVDFSAWQEVGVISEAPNTLIDPRVPGATGRFYRAVTLP